MWRARIVHARWLAEYGCCARAIRLASGRCCFLAQYVTRSTTARIVSVDGAMRYGGGVR